jgi:hypothetical protein
MRFIQNGVTYFLCKPASHELEETRHLQQSVARKHLPLLKVYQDCAEFVVLFTGPRHSL